MNRCLAHTADPLVWCALGIAVAGACGGGGAATATPPSEPERPAFTSVAVAPPALVLPVGGVAQLVVSAHDQYGSAIGGPVVAAYTSSDPARAAVDANGRVSALAAGGATIEATVTLDGVSRSAAAAVTVEASPPGAAPPAAATVTTPDRRFTPASVTIAAGGTVTWTSTDNRHDVSFLGAAPPGGDIVELREGDSASRTFPAPGTYTYRCSRHGDTGVVEVRDGGSGPVAPPPPPTAVTLTTPGTRYEPASATLAVGGRVTWQFTGTRHNVTFQGAAPPEGNIPDTEPGNSVTRTFPEAGTYDYVCTRHQGMTGRLVVQ